ncbi:hypothetical protein [Sporolactobacillus pectinivorans]|uniref:hypothetical protein n=1 Tax=Sporolactobacillus pectinivorans TaxID=1591408 RepID=UPI000C2610BA|nr:hypothetical protein [Sporolactobacillus pectinivorans]
MRWLLKLYPRAWRVRYEDEMLAVLEEHKITLVTMIDLLIGALDANLNFSFFTEGVSYMTNRIRSGIVMVFGAFVLYGVGWSLLQRLNDPVPNFQVVDKIHPEFGVLYHAVFIVGSISFLTILIGGLPIFFISVKRAFKNRKSDVLHPFWFSLSCLLLFALFTAIFTVMLVFWHLQAYIFALLIGYLILSTLLLIAGTAAVSLVVIRTEFQLSEIKFVYIPEIVILFGMAVSVVLSTILIVQITVHSPQLFMTQDVNSLMFITGLFLMSLGTIFASMGLKRGSIKGLDQITQA